MFPRCALGYTANTEMLLADKTRRFPAMTYVGEDREER
jgi:hypothetical protein